MSIGRTLLRRCLRMAWLLLLLPGSIANADLVDIDSARLAELLAQSVPIVDVRTAGEWGETGVVPGSHLLTFFNENGGFDAKAWYAQFEPIADPQTPVILICHSGTRSKVIGFWLSQSLDYTTVYNVADGIVQWQRDSGATVPPSRQ